MRTSIGWLAMMALVAGCGDAPLTDAGTDAFALDAPIDGGELDSGIDAAVDDAPSGDAPSGDAPSEDAAAASCDEAMRPDLGAEVQNSRGLVIARDGTMYFSQPGGVGRRTPDGTLSTGWLSMPDTDLVAAVALDASNDVLFVGVPDYDEVDATTVYRVDVGTRAISPLANGGSAFGIAVGPDGNVYFTGAGEHVFRVAPAGGSATQVTTAIVPSPRSLAFESDGSLLVASGYLGQIFRLTLDDGVESARVMVGIIPSVFGLALDAEGRIYAGSNGGGALYRMGADGTGTEMLTAAATPFGLAFGHGALCERDLFFDGGQIGRFENDTPGAAVLWH